MVPSLRGKLQTTTYLENNQSILFSHEQVFSIHLITFLSTDPELPHLLRQVQLVFTSFVPTYNCE